VLVTALAQEGLDPAQPIHTVSTGWSSPSSGGERGVNDGPDLEVLPSRSRMPSCGEWSGWLGWAGRSRARDACEKRSRERVVADPQQASLFSSSASTRQEVGSTTRTTSGPHSAEFRQWVAQAMAEATSSHRTEMAAMLAMASQLDISSAETAAQEAQRAQAEADERGAR
jgi:hypothetical protein